MINSFSRWKLPSASAMSRSSERSRTISTTICPRPTTFSSKSTRKPAGSPVKPIGTPPFRPVSTLETQTTWTTNEARIITRLPSTRIVRINLSKVWVTANRPPHPSLMLKTHLRCSRRRASYRDHSSSSQLTVRQLRRNLRRPFRTNLSSRTIAGNSQRTQRPEGITEMETGEVWATSAEQRATTEASPLMSTRWSSARSIRRLLRKPMRPMLLPVVSISQIWGHTSLAPALTLALGVVEVEILASQARFQNLNLQTTQKIQLNNSLWKSIFKTWNRQHITKLAHPLKHRQEQHLFLRQACLSPQHTHRPRSARSKEAPRSRNYSNSSSRSMRGKLQPSPPQAP